jgi:hypothetical protein
MVSADRLDGIRTGVEKIKQDKPYAEDAEAIAALDWISAAAVDVNAELGRSAADTSAMAHLHELLGSLDALHTSVTAAMKRKGQEVPRRHDDVPAATVNPS